MRSYDISDVVAMPVDEFLKLDFEKPKPTRKIWQRCLGPHGDGTLFWDTYLHPECVEVDPGAQNDFTTGYKMQ
jgi:hypothetical protein